MEITALFDDVDMAEFALVNLQSLGIFPQGYKIRSLHTEERGRDTLVPAADGFTNNLAVNPPGAVPTNLGVAGFALSDTSYGGTAFGGGELPNREVQLRLTVDDVSAHRAQSALISNHGRRIRIV